MSSSNANQETTSITTPAAANHVIKANISTPTSKPVSSARKKLLSWTPISAAQDVPQARTSTVLLINVYDMAYDY